MSDRRRRQQKTTCLIVCEGKADKSFLDFLKQTYQNSTWSFRVEKAGGDPQSVIRRAKKICSGYDEVYCISDNDKDITMSIPRSITSLRISPCLEAFLLNIVYGQSVSQNIKSTFETHFNREAQKIDKDDWARRISKEQLESWRFIFSELNALIEIFENP